MKESFRSDSREHFTYQDRIFDNDMNRLLNSCEEAYNNLMFREAIKAGFYDLQASRDRYRDITAAGDGMNWKLLERFIEVWTLDSGVWVMNAISFVGGRFKPQFSAQFVHTLLSMFGVSLEV